MNEIIPDVDTYTWGASSKMMHGISVSDPIITGPDNILHEWALTAPRSLRSGQRPRYYATSWFPKRGNEKLSYEIFHAIRNACMCQRVRPVTGRAKKRPVSKYTPRLYDAIPSNHKVPMCSQITAYSDLAHPPVFVDENDVPILDETLLYPASGRYRHHAFADGYIHARVSFVFRPYWHNDVVTVSCRLIKVQVIGT